MPSLGQPCACILHNNLIDQPVPPDWFNETIEELDQDDELNQSMEQGSGDTRCNQVFAYLLDECQAKYQNKLKSLCILTNQLSLIID